MVWHRKHSTVIRCDGIDSKVSRRCFGNRLDTAARLAPQDVNAAGSSVPPKMQRFEASKKTVGLAGGRKLLSEFRISGGLRGFWGGRGEVVEMVGAIYFGGW